MASEVTLQEISEIGIMPDNEVAQFEIDFPGIALKFASSCTAVAASYCQKRHEMPWVTVPDAVKYHIVQLTVYKMYLKRGFNPASEQDSNIKLSYDESIQWLKDVAKGLVELPRDYDSTPDLDENGPLFGTSNNPYDFIDEQAKAFRNGEGCGC